MKRLFVFALIPFALFALEKVNLIKDAGFEKNSDVWNAYVGRGPSHGLIPAAVVSTHDSEKVYSGYYSAFCETRDTPENVEIPDMDSALTMQGFCVEKYATDLDSLFIRYLIIPLDNDLNKAHVVLFGLYLDAKKPNNRTAIYYLRTPVSSITLPSPYIVLGEGVIPNDTNWYLFAKNIKGDLERLGFSSSTTVDSLILSGWGLNYPPWHGQKIYLDDIRLTGYADYDVGVKGILSRDSIGNAYTPTARIKNFGRKAADSFLVIATIEGGAGVVYADTLSWSLTADTEDTVSFKEFQPSDALDYTLTVSTIMTPDESDEDDVMSKPLYGSGVEEQPIPQALSLDVLSLQAGEGVLRVSYSLPLGEQGSISLYDPTGRRIEFLHVTGSGSVSLKSGLSSGVYFVKLESGKASVTRKAVVLR